MLDAALAAVVFPLQLEGIAAGLVVVPASFTDGFVF